MGTQRARSVVLDAGALIAFERNDERVCRLIELAVKHRGAVHVPAGVVAQVWRDGRKQVRLGRLVGSGWLSIQVLDVDEAKGAGALCGRTKSSDIVDASVALLARRHGAVVVTSDPHDIRRFDEDLEIVEC